MHRREAVGPGGKARSRVTADAIGGHLRGRGVKAGPVGERAGLSLITQGARRARASERAGAADTLKRASVTFGTAIVLACCQHTHHALSGASRRQVLFRGSNAKRRRPFAMPMTSMLLSNRFDRRRGRHDGTDCGDCCCSPSLDALGGNSGRYFSLATGRPATSHASSPPRYHETFG
jgi:hypothetical protein